MAITVEEMRALEPGDIVRIISLEEYEEHRSDNAFDHWCFSMCRCCDQEFTVRSSDFYKIYVYENSFYWLPEFIDRIVESPSKMPALSEEDMASLLFLR